MYLLQRLCTTCQYQTTATCWERVLRTELNSEVRRSLHSTVQNLKYVPVASIIGWQLWEPEWVSFGGAPVLNGAYLGPFIPLFQNP